jgi:hypothetical protein
MQTFSVPDRSGVVHHYTLDLHGGTEGFGISASLLAAGLPALAEGLQGIIADSGAATVAELLDSPAAMRLLKAGDVAERLQAALRSLDLGALAPVVLKHTQRDGERLSNRAVFDRVYQGNYDELYQALWRVTMLNGFLPGSSFWSASA